MNAARRKQLDEALTNLTTLCQDIETLVAEIDDIKDQEQEYYDNMPEAIQNGDKGTTAEAAIDQLESAADLLREFDFDAIEAALSRAKGD